MNFKAIIFATLTTICTSTSYAIDHKGITHTSLAPERFTLVEQAKPITILVDEADERALFDASAHFISSLLAVSALDDELIGTVLLRAGLVAQSRLAPGSHRTGTADRCTAFAAAVGMVVGVHDGAADGGTDAHVTLAAGLTDVDVLVVQVAHLTDAGGAVGPDVANLAGGQADLSQIAFLGHQLRSGTGGTNQLSAVAGLQLHVVDDGTHGDVGDGQAVAGQDVGVGGGYHHIAGLQAVRSQNVGQGIVLVLDQCDISGAVGIVLDALHGGGHLGLQTLEVDHTILPLVSAALVADGDVTIAVATGMLLQGLNQATLRFCLLVHAVEAGNSHVAAGGGVRLKSLNCHLRFSPF